MPSQRMPPDRYPSCSASVSACFKGKRTRLAVSIHEHREGLSILGFAVALAVLPGLDAVLDLFGDAAGSRAWAAHAPDVDVDWDGPPMCAGDRSAPATGECLLMDRKNLIIIAAAALIAISLYIMFGGGGEIVVPTAPPQTAPK